MVHAPITCRSVAELDGSGRRRHTWHVARAGGAENGKDDARSSPRAAPYRPRDAAAHSPPVGCLRAFSLVKQSRFSAAHDCAGKKRCFRARPSKQCEEKTVQKAGHTAGVSTTGEGGRAREKEIAQFTLWRRQPSSSRQCRVPQRPRRRPRRRRITMTTTTTMTSRAVPSAMSAPPASRSRTRRLAGTSAATRCAAAVAPGGSRAHASASAPGAGRRRWRRRPRALWASTAPAATTTLPTAAEAMAAAALR